MYPKSRNVILSEAHAKINLFLEVLAKLPDHYHQIETLLCSVSLCDVIKYTLTKTRDIKLWSNVPELAAEDNLICTIARYLAEKCKPDSGVEIYLDKRIPIAAGLGGGSSDAANALVALNTLWNAGLSLAEIEDIASKFGSDICFFLHGGTALGINRGEQIIAQDDILIDNILLVNPNIRIPAARAYEVAKVPEASNSQVFRPEAWRQSCFNRLEAGMRVEFCEVDYIIRQLEVMGARPALMSGSGSTCFGVFDNAEALKACQQCFNQTGYWTMNVRTISRNEYQSVFQT